MILTLLELADINIMIFDTYDYKWNFILEFNESLIVMKFERVHKNLRRFK